MFIHGELSMSDPREVAGIVFLTTISIPSLVTLGLRGDITVGSMGNGSPQLTSSIVLESTRYSIRGRLVVLVGVEEVMAVNLDPGEVVGLVFRTTISIPSLVTLGLRGDVAVGSVGNG